MASKLMYMPRDFRLHSTKGYAIQFIANEPVNVPHRAIDEAIAIGAVFADKQDQKILVDEKPEPVVADLGFEREQKIYDACTDILNRNDPDDFTPANKPKLAAITKLVGYEVDRKEANEIWKKVMQASANAT